VFYYIDFGFYWDTLGSMRRRQTSIRIDGPDYKKLEKQAKAEGLNVADLIRRAIREFVTKKQ